MFVMMEVCMTDIFDNFCTRVHCTSQDPEVTTALPESAEERNYFMVDFHERYVAGAPTRTTGFAVRCTVNCASGPGAIEQRLFHFINVTYEPEHDKSTKSHVCPANT